MPVTLSRRKMAINSLLVVLMMSVSGAAYAQWTKTGTNVYTTVADGTLRTHAYTYDAFGNMKSNSPAGTLGVNVVNNRLQSSSVNSRIYGYDTRGNLTGVATQGNTGYPYAYFYDAVNMMRRSDGTQTIAYIYNADDERIASYDVTNSKSTWTLRDMEGKVLRELSGTGAVGTETLTWARDYIYRDTLLLASESATEGRRHHHLDHLGTPRLITDGTGVKKAFHTYYPFGVEATLDTQDSERKKYTGHERDKSLGGYNTDLDYMHARHNNPTLGRFLTVDPVRSAVLSNPQSWNRYTYALNNPLMFVDPDGRCAVPAGLKEGLVGICIQSFIAAPRFSGFGFGDDRTFAKNNRDATFRTSYKMVMDPATGNVINEDAKPGVSKAGILKPMIAIPGETSVTGATTTGPNGTMISLHITGENGLSAVTTFGNIGILATLNVTADGDVSVDSSASRTKGYPSIEGYAYRIINGQLVIEVLFQTKEGDPDELKEEDLTVTLGLPR